MNDQDFEKLIEIMKQLTPAARRDVLDMAAFIVWKQTRAPLAIPRLLRGGWLFVGFKFTQAWEKVKVCL